MINRKLVIQSGPLLMSAAALIFTGLNLLIKILGPEFRIWDIAFYRFFGGMIILTAILGRNGNPFTGVNRKLLVLRGCCGAAAFLSMITAIRYLPISTAMVLFYSFPAFAAIFSVIFYKERISKLGILCIACVLIGVMILFDFHLQGNLYGQLIGVLGGVFAGITVTLIRNLRTCNGPAVIYYYFCVIGLMISFPVFIAAPVIPWTASQWLICAGIIATSLSAQLLMNQGFYYCKGWEGGLFMSSEVIFTALAGIIFLNEVVSSRFIAGSLMIVGSIILLNMVTAKAK